ncbi:MAG: hypothetical protein JNN08_21970 [Bryobacterales bacterium]|nr:hypothetical protein [Bryobacterales bacterium]
MTKEEGVQYFTQFIELVALDTQFRTDVVKWGCFQMLDYDVLLGYSDRFAGGERRLVVTEVLEHWNSAVSSREVEDRLREALAGVSKDLTDLEHTPSSVTGFRDVLEKLELDRKDDAISILNGLQQEITEFDDKARRMRFAAEGFPLLLIAYVGSVCRRGWQYFDMFAEASSRLSPLTYLPHRLRGDFLWRFRRRGAKVKSKRFYCWSWGHLVARSIEQFPHAWTASKVCLKLEDLRRRMSEQSLSISLDIGDSEGWRGSVPSLTDDVRGQLTAMARDAGIVVASPKSTDEWGFWIASALRALPALGVPTLAKLLSVQYDIPKGDVLEILSTTYASELVKVTMDDHFRDAGLLLAPRLQELCIEMNGGADEKVIGEVATAAAHSIPRAVAEAV